MMRLAEAWRESGIGRWYAGLSQRDQRIVAGLGAAVVVVFAYVAVWQPVSSWSDAAERRWMQGEARLDWMRAHADEARARAQSGQREDAASSLLTLVANTAQEEGVQLSRFQPQGGGGVSVVLQGQAFERVLRWLHRLEAREGVVVRQVSLDGRNSDGLVSARVNIG